jgi:membrane-bound lytic murein transglycosylase B
VGVPVVAGAVALQGALAAANRVRRAVWQEAEGASGGRGPRKSRRRRWVVVAVSITVLVVVAPVMLTSFLAMQRAAAARDEAMAATGEIIGAAAVLAMQVESGACPLPVAQMADAVAEVDGIADPASIRPALDAYCSAARAYEVDWAFLAGIGRMECFHGLSRLAGCNPDLRNPDGSRRTNTAGARGPMQFLGSTWRSSAGAFDPEVAGPEIPEGQEHLGYATDGDDPDSVADPWSWPDAAHAAARYLVVLGAKDDQARAAHGYYNGGGAPFDPDHFYHRGVLRHASEYRVAVPSPMPGPSSAAVAGPVSLTTVEGITVHTAIAEDVRALVQAARADGLSLTGDGYRSHEQQIALRRAHCGTTHYDIWQRPASQCSPPTAIPGRSNHERGLAIDFECGGNGNYIGSRDHPCFRWLAANAAAYGLFNLPSEPWHWSVDGT